MHSEHLLQGLNPPPAATVGTTSTYTVCNAIQYAAATLTQCRELDPLIVEPWNLDRGPSIAAENIQLAAAVGCCWIYLSLVKELSCIPLSS